MDSCFDYSRCSLSSQFPVYFYSPDEFPAPPGPTSPVAPSGADADPARSFIDAAAQSPHMISDPAGTCAFLALLPPSLAESRNASTAYLRSLPHWGRNHVVVAMATDHNATAAAPPSNEIRVASSFAASTPFRRRYDIVCPPLASTAFSSTGGPVDTVSPVRRRHLLSFVGEWVGGAGDRVSALALTLRQMSATFSNSDRPGGFVFSFACTPPGGIAAGYVADEWALCAPTNRQPPPQLWSTFSLILDSDLHMTTLHFQVN